jgi:cellulose biosynthesis protein BcsQ
MNVATEAEIMTLLNRAIAPNAAPAPHFVFIDTPPAFAAHVRAAMRAASVILIPTDPTREGLYGLMDVLDLHTRLALSTPIRAVLTRVTGILKDQNEMVRRTLDTEAPYADMPRLRCPVEIPFSKASAESAQFELPTTIVAPAGRASVAYRKLVAELGQALGIRLRTRRVRVPEITSTATDSTGAPR